MEEAMVDTAATEAMVVTEAMVDMEAGAVKEVAGADKPSLHNLPHLLEDSSQLSTSRAISRTIIKKCSKDCCSKNP